MWAVNKVAEEGGAEVTAGMEACQDKVWIALQAVFLRVYTLLKDRVDTCAAVLSGLICGHLLL